MASLRRQRFTLVALIPLGRADVWEAAARAAVNKTADCHRDNSPPCACSRRGEDALFGAALSSELPGALDSDLAVDAAREFAILRFAPTAERTRGCARFAIEISGAAGGIGALNATARRISDASGGADIFAHVYAVRDAPAELAVLRAAFGPALRAVVFERWSSAVEEHIFSVANRAASASAPRAFEWLVGQLSDRFSRRRCGVRKAGMSPEHRCAISWRTVLAHVLSMWRKVFLASELRAAHERARACAYDVVVRTRADAKPARALDLRRFVKPVRAAPSTAHALCPMRRRYRKRRAQTWPATACWADDQVGLGGRSAMRAYARLFPEFHRFVWWYPLARADAWMHVSERLLGVHFDWRARAAGAPAGRREPFSWEVKQPDGKIDFNWLLDREVCYRCMSDRAIPQTRKGAGDGVG
ncbi:hypothetical protein KFE25_009394 [Diacronema lutheri]|uniref:Uncharacterized protein n=2 Tax=Diacronema lutheri TaxID=2081491 RepID=A0A8J5XMK6_DIALT|nr:hypothetical protein KFE25_009394 [Diacronema lutheri]